MSETPENIERGQKAIESYMSGEITYPEAMRILSGVCGLQNAALLLKHAVEKE